MAGINLAEATAAHLIQRFLPLLSGAALMGGAAFSYPGREYALVGFMLFLPLLDRHWGLPALSYRRSRLFAWTGLTLAIASLLAWQPQFLGFGVSTLLLAALPEEWFFRAYFMVRLGANWQANFITSLLFALLHGLVWGLTTAFLVFFPSLFFGWLYQRTQDLVLLVLVHTLSNLFFTLFLADSLTI
jgi:membrane protease YdiL (CAAX protease family)